MIRAVSKDFAGRDGQRTGAKERPSNGGKNRIPVVQQSAKSGPTSGQLELFGYEALSIHELADLLPLMSEPEFQSLKSDIRRNGQREPITLCDGQVIDGRHRLRACRELGIEPITVELDSELAKDPTTYVLSANLHRRQLTKSQRALLAARVACRAVGENQFSDKVGGQNCPPSIEDAAAEFGVSPTLIKNAKIILGAKCQELTDRVDKGEITVSLAVAMIKHFKTPGELAGLAKLKVPDIRTKIQAGKQTKTLRDEPRPFDESLKSIGDLVREAEACKNRTEVMKRIEALQARRKPPTWEEVQKLATEVGGKLLVQFERGA